MYYIALAWPTRVSNQNMVMCSCNAPFPQGLHPLGGRLGTPGGNCKSATYPHQPQESPPRAPYILRTNKTFTGEKSLSYPLLAPCFCTVGLLSFPLSSPLSLDLSLHRLRSAYQLLRNQAPRPSSATKLRDHVQRRQAAPAVFQMSPPTMLRSATHRNTV